MATQVTRHASSSEGMTLGELMQFVQEAEAAGVDPREVVLARVGFSAQVKRITAGGKIF